MMIPVVMKSRWSVLVKSKSSKTHVIPGCGFLKPTTCSPGQRGTPDPHQTGRVRAPGGNREPNPGPGFRLRAPAGSPESPAHAPPQFTRPAGSCSSAVRRPARPRLLLRFLFAPDEGEDSGQRSQAQRTPDYNSRWTQDSSTLSQVLAS